jgi:uncharacterized tellurite resistance protein B-like protein
MKTALLIALTATACKKAPLRDCSEFQEAERLLDQISNTTLDPTFADPRYAPAVAAFEAIPKDCSQHESAMTIAATIRNAMRAKPPPAAPPVESAVVPPPSSSENDQTAREVADYLQKIEAVPPAPDGSDGAAYASKLMMEAETNEEAAKQLDEWSARAEADLRGMNVPDPCREFHALMLENMQLKGELLDDLAEAIEANDKSAVDDIKARRETVRENDRKLAQMKAQLAQRYRPRGG